MKNLLMLVFLILGITSCSKDSLDPAQEQNLSIVKSEILVTASYIVYNQGQCGNSCGSNDQSIAYVTNATVKVFPGDVQDIDEAVTPLVQGRTDSAGKMLVKDLEPGLYSVFVQSSYGNKSRVLYTQLNKRSFIEFSF
jgi:hypothetical protein